MSVTLLDRATATRLKAAPFTYRPVGATVDVDTMPQVPGMHVLERSAPLHRRDLDGAAADLWAWQLQARSGLDVAASDTPMREGTAVLMRLGVGPLALRIPCRVIAVIDEPERKGFVYGTLPGHPESGEERFVVERRPDGVLVLTVGAFSRPASRLARAGGPAGRAFQRFMTGRYLRALDAG